MHDTALAVGLRTTAEPPKQRTVTALRKLDRDESFRALSLPDRMVEGCMALFPFQWNEKASNRHASGSGCHAANRGTLLLILDANRSTSG